jgi:AmmeMemoRadiSam system protein B
MKNLLIINNQYKKNLMDVNVKKIRSASHAGSWYSSSNTELKSQINSFFEKAYSNKFPSEKTPTKILKSLIVPHAGFRYSGQTASHSFQNINKSLYKRVIILGPSHHEYLEGCGLSKFHEIETPLGNLKIDVEANNKLKNLKNFNFIDENTDEEEHSLEMQYPFLKNAFGEEDVKFLPIMVGELNNNLMEISNSLLDFYKDKKTLFVISSDFCHWGKRFRYTYYDQNNGKIFESIENLDKMGMKAIESLDPNNFIDYLNVFKNTICGRRPITLLLGIIDIFNKENNLNKNVNMDLKNNDKEKEQGFEYENFDNFIKFVEYDQSSKAIEANDSSVSYAAGVNFVEEKYLI